MTTLRGSHIKKISWLVTIILYYRCNDSDKFFVYFVIFRKFMTLANSDQNVLKY